MKLRDVIAQVDRSASNKCSTTNLMEEFGLYDWVDLDEHGFSSYHLATWLCTDTWVGAKVIFYKDEAIAWTWQNARKNDTSFWWIGGVQTYNRIYLVCIGLIEPPSETKAFGVANLDEDVGLGIKVSYSQQLLDDVVILDVTGERVEVVGKATHRDPTSTWDKVTVITHHGDQRTIPMSSITVPWRTTHAPDDPS